MVFGAIYNCIVFYIIDYVRRNVLKSVFSRRSTKYMIKRTKKVNFSSDSSSESNSSSNSNFTEEEEEEKSSSSGLDVSINDIYVNKGVLQGSILSPILFNFFRRTIN